MNLIKVLIGERLISTHNIEKENVILGRSPDVDIFIPNLSVSRRHGRIFKKNDRWFYEDLCSTNGTYANLSKITLCQITAGMELIIGKCRVIFIESNQRPIDTPSSAYISDWKKLFSEEEENESKISKIDETIKFDKTAAIKINLNILSKDQKRETKTKPIAYIEFVDRKEKINIDEDLIYIGKDPDCRIKINGLMIAPKHAKIQFDGERIKLVALKGFPSVSVNGQKITERILKKDDYIDIGSYRFRLRYF